MQYPTAVERFSPLLMVALLDAMQRLNPGLLRSICHSERIDLNGVDSAARLHDLLACGDLPQRLPALLPYRQYHETAVLAGRIATTKWIEREGLRIRRSGSSFVVARLLQRILPAFCGHSEFNCSARGDLHVIELADSLFARQVKHAHPVCGFYTGLLHEVGSVVSRRGCQAGEMVCRAAEPGANCCMFELSLRDTTGRRVSLGL